MRKERRAAKEAQKKRSSVLSLLLNEIPDDVFSLSVSLHTLELLESRPCLYVVSEVLEV